MPDPVTGITVGGSLLGGLISSSAAGDAADTQAAAADRASQVQWDMYNQTRKDQQPFLQTGVAANQQLAYLMGLAPTPSAATPVGGAPVAAATSASPVAGRLDSSMWTPMTQQQWAQADPFNHTTRDQYQQYLSNFTTPTQSAATPGAAPAASTANNGYANVNPATGGFGSLAKPFGMSDFQADPGYDFRMSEGQKALERSAAAKGGLMSGSALKAITRFGQDTASGEYQNAYNRYTSNQTNLYNRLAGLGGSGQTSANTLANVGQNTANAVGNNGMEGAYQQAAGGVAQANSWSTGLSNVGSKLSNFFQPSNSLPWQSAGNVNPAGGFY